MDCTTVYRVDACRGLLMLLVHGLAVLLWSFKDVQIESIGTNKLVATGANSSSLVEVTIGSGLSFSAGTLTATASSDSVALSDAATIATDASLGSNFRVTLGGNRTLGNPTNPSNGQVVIWEVIQDATGIRTLAFDTKFAFGTDIPSITLTTNATKRDFIRAIYNSTSDKWYVIGAAKGY